MDPPVFIAEDTRERLCGRCLRKTCSTCLRRAIPIEKMGGAVKRCLGLNAYIRPENPRGHRLCELFVNGEAVEPSRSYRIAFATTQAAPEKYIEQREKLDLTAVEALRRYFASEGTVNAPLRDTFVAI
jgi:S-sulfosulfanyl-L-cysteine sulfohydrolase